MVLPQSTPNCSCEAANSSGTSVCVEKMEDSKTATACLLSPKKQRPPGMKCFRRVFPVSRTGSFPRLLGRAMADFLSAKPRRVQLWKIMFAMSVFLFCLVYMEQGGGALWTITSIIGLPHTPVGKLKELAEGVKLESVSEEQLFAEAGKLPETVIGADEDGVGENDSSTQSLSPAAEGKGRENDRSLKETCNLYQGEWVVGEPLYSGKQCSILAKQWACRNSKRTDFGYENWRWRPSACDLPTFDANDFLERLRNKAVVFMGDSLGQQQFQSLMCLLAQGDIEKNAKEVNAKYDFYTPMFGPQRTNGTAYLFEATNTTVIMKGNAFLGDIVPFNITHPAKGGYLEIGRVDSWLQKNFAWIDILILNTGHHWGWHGLHAAKLTPIEAGKEIVNRKGHPVLASSMQQRVMGRLMRFLEQAAAKRADPKPLIYFRSLSPRHFLDGEWNTGGRCDNVKSQFGKSDMRKRPAIDEMAENALRGRKHVQLLNITYLSQFRGEAHLSVWWLNYDAKSNVQDCLHWCLPGVPDTWNEILYANIILNDRQQKQQKQLASSDRR